MVMHCLKQQDDYNGILQRRRGEPGPVREWHFLPVYECFDLWGLDHRLPGPDEEPALTVHEVLAMQETMQAALRRYLDGQAELARGLLGICDAVDGFVRAADAYAALLGEQPESASREVLLEGLRKQKEFFQGLREHFWEIGTILARGETEPAAARDDFHALLHDFDPGEEEMN